MPHLESKQVAKKKKIVLLPTEYMQRVVIPTRITEAQYSFTMIQERIFNYVLFYLQHHIIKTLEGEDVRQLDLFKTKDENILVSIPMGMIGKPAYYNRIRESVIEMAQILVKIPITKNHEEYARIRGLFQYIDLPGSRKMRTSSMDVQISKDVAELLINIEWKSGQAVGYTKFLYEVCMTAKNKYTPRIYKILSSWRKKGKCYISLDELRTMLQLADKYTTYDTIKRKILKPVYEELKRTADIWFDMDHPDFEVKEGTKVVGVRLYVETQVDTLRYVKLKETYQRMLVEHFGLTKAQLEQVDHVLDFTQSDSADALHYKLQELHNRIRQDNSIKHVSAYVVTALKNYHKPR